VLAADWKPQIGTEYGGRRKVERMKPNVKKVVGIGSGYPEARSHHRRRDGGNRRGTPLIRQVFNQGQRACAESDARKAVIEVWIAAHPQQDVESSVIPAA